MRAHMDRVEFRGSKGSMQNAQTICLLSHSASWNSLGDR